MSGAVALKDFNWFDRRWLLDTASGRVEPTTEQPAHGFIVLELTRQDQPQDNAFAAVYADDGTMWFQTDAERWPVRELKVERTVTDDSRVARGLVKRGDQEVAAFTYPNPLNDPVVRSDPTFDAIDAEMADFFLYLMNVTAAPDWADRTVEHWQAGMR